MTASFSFSVSFRQNGFYIEAGIRIISFSPIEGIVVRHYASLPTYPRVFDALVVSGWHNVMIVHPGTTKKSVVRCIDIYDEAMYIV